MLSAIVLALSGVAGGEFRNGNPPPEILPETLETVVVEAAKQPTSANEITSRVALIDAADIQKQLAQNIQDLVRYEPGVDVVDQGSRFGLSGISIRGIGGNRVRIEVDGVATSDAFSIGSFSNASRDFVDVDSVKQVEIVRGPASTLFGSDALGGVVSFVTKRPEDYLLESDTHFDLSAGYNSMNHGNVLTGTSAFRAGNVTALVRATLRQNSERDIVGADPLSEESRNLSVKLNSGRAGEGGLELTLEQFRVDGETNVDSLERVQNFTQAFGFPYVIDTSEVFADDERSRVRLSAGQEWLAGRFGTDYLQWRLYRQDSETRQNTREARTSLIGSNQANVVRQRQFLFNQSLTGLEINASNDFAFLGLQHQLGYGIEYEQTDTEQLRAGTETDVNTGLTSSQVGPDLLPVRDFPMSNTQRTGVYLQNRISVGSLTFMPSLRWDRFELEPEQDSIFAQGNPGITPVNYSDDQLSPKVGVLWQLDDQWQLYGQYSEGFRAPPVNDVNVGFTNFQFGYTTLPNPDLESESSRGYEFGFRWNTEIASIEMAAFSTRYDDFIESFQSVGFDPVNQLVQFQSINLDAVRIEGAEMSGAFQPAFFPNGLKMNLALAYADGKNLNSSQPLNSVAPFNGVLGFDYAPPSQRWGANFVARGASRQTNLDETAGPRLSPAGFVVFDTFAFWQASEQLRVRAGITNLSDHEYVPYLDVQGLTAQASLNRFQRPGRQVNIAFDWTF
ncbi:MAG: TonB-dependent hemoglobin/transferrin/lactoferrin family receptor [Gammaproteobacteria bacterium]